MSAESAIIIVRAADFAARYHVDHRRKGPRNRPYVNHLIEVCYLLVGAGETDSAVLAAALLHDVVEDTSAEIEDVRREFGAEVARLVAEVSDDKSLPKAVRKRLQVEHAPQLSPKAALIKLADKLSNVRDMVVDPPSWSEERVIAYVVWAEDVVLRLPVADGPLLREFREVCSAVRERVDTAAQRLDDQELTA